MKLNRTLHHVFLENGKPHQMSQFAGEAIRFPGMVVGPVLVTTNPALVKEAFHSEDIEIFSEEGDSVSITLNLCLDRKPPNPVIDLKQGGRQIILRYLRENAGLEYVYQQKTPLSISPLGNESVKGKFTLINRFSVIGSFKIIDINLFERAFNEGIGRRFSYGYGLLMLSAAK